MLRIITSSSAAIAEQLASPSFRRLNIEHRAFDTGAAILAELDERGAQLVIIETKLPDMTGYTLCERVRGQETMRQVRVMLALPREELAPVALQRVAAVGCDDILALPAPGEELYQQVARLFKLPQRLGRRMSVELFADIEAQEAGGVTRTLVGRVTNLSPTGARAVLDQTGDEAVDFERVRLTLSRPLEGREVAVEGRVVWRGEPRSGEGLSFGIEFERLDEPSRRALAALSLWEVVALPDRTQVVFQGDLTEVAEFDDLAERLSGVVEFDLGAVRYLNSAGVRKWVLFLEALRNVSAYTFVRCSTAFVVQASMVSRLLGYGRIDSFWAPYICETCEIEDQRLLHVSQPSTMSDMAEAQFRCSGCGGPLVLDEVPERVFAFLESDEGRGPPEHSGEGSFG
ncbi:MAG TPA: PilZ domain-containing protein [Polyangia bacterium]